MEGSPPRVSLEPASRRKLSETVAQQLMEAFKDLPPGDEGPLRARADQGSRASADRPCARPSTASPSSACSTIRHGQGAFIAEDAAADGGEVEAPQSVLTAALQRGETREFIEARLLVEVEVTRLAAERRTDEDLQRIEAALGDPGAEPLRGRHRTTARRRDLVQRAARRGGPQRGARGDDPDVRRADDRARARSCTRCQGFGDWDLAEHRGIYEAVRDQDRTSPRTGCASTSCSWPTATAKPAPADPLRSGRKSLYGQGCRLSAHLV